MCLCECVRCWQHAQCGISEPQVPCLGKIDTCTASRGFRRVERGHAADVQGLAPECSINGAAPKSKHSGSFPPPPTLFVSGLSPLPAPRFHQHMQPISQTRTLCHEQPVSPAAPALPQIPSPVALGCCQPRPASCPSLPPHTGFLSPAWERDPTPPGSPT